MLSKWIKDWETDTFWKLWDSEIRYKFRPRHCRTKHVPPVDRHPCWLRENLIIWWHDNIMCACACIIAHVRMCVRGGVTRILNQQQSAAIALLYFWLLFELSVAYQSRSGIPLVSLKRRQILICFLLLSAAPLTIIWRSDLTLSSVKPGPVSSRVYPGKSHQGARVLHCHRVIRILSANWFIQDGPQSSRSSQTNSCETIDYRFVKAHNGR